MAETPPDFILMGQQKAATRWLYDQLRNADRFWLPPVKEITYFVGDLLQKTQLRKLVEKAQAGSLGEDLSQADMLCIQHLCELHRARRIDDAGYLKIFSFKGDKISGDITPRYEMLDDDGVRHVLRVAPNAKFIYFVRHPVERLESAIRMWVGIQSSFPAECLTDVHLMKEIMQRRVVVKRASPTRTWKRWSAAAASGRVSYWFFDDIRDQPERVRREIVEYIGAPDTKFSIDAGYDRKGGRRSAGRFSPDVREYVRSVLQPEIDECRAVFGGRAQEW